MKVRAKKHLGQHFLKDETISKKIVAQVTNHDNTYNILEIGPGMGAITKYFLENKNLNLEVIEIDTESVEYLKNNFPALQNKIYSLDFLKTDLTQFFNGEQFIVVGNFPYNISSQILFHCLEFREQIPEIMGMFQKEVAQRIAEPPGSKVYGILSVLMQTYYDISYCFTVHEGAFSPPPKIKSGVIRCTRNQRKKLPVDETLYTNVVKTTFNQRRKTIRNSLKNSFDTSSLPETPLLNLRPERLSVEDFIQLTQLIQNI